MKRAAAIDPDNPHLQAQALMWEPYGDNAGTNVKLRRDRMEKLVALDQLAGDKLWPRFHDDLANDYSFLKMYDKEIQKLEWLRQYEPAYKTSEYYNTSIRITKKWMTEKAIREEKRER